MNELIAALVVGYLSVVVESRPPNIVFFLADDIGFRSVVELNRKEMWHH